MVVLLYGSPGPRFPRPNPKRGRKDRSRQNTAQDAFVCIGSRPKTFETVPTVVCPCLSSSSDDHHLSHSCLGTSMRFGTQKQVLSLSCIIGSFGVLDCFLIPVGVLVGAVSRYCHSWYRLFGPQQPWQILVRCVLVNTSQYHDTVDVVQDS